MTTQIEKKFLPSSIPVTRADPLRGILPAPDEVWKAETELTLSLMVKTLQRLGDEWKPIKLKDLLVTLTIEVDTKTAYGMYHVIANACNLQVDPQYLLNSGYMRFLPEGDWGGKGLFEITPEGVAWLEKAYSERAPRRA